MMRKRNEIPALLNSLGLLDSGVEVGVFGGIFSEIILSQWHGSKLYLVDAWAFLPDYHDPLYRAALGDRSIDSQHMSAEQWEEILDECRKRIARFEGRYEIMRKTSAEAAKDFKQACLDFVYIDADHSYAACKADLECWYPKLKIGGLFSGHDYFNGDYKGALFGVKQAVDEFCAEQRIKNLKITKSDKPASWYWVKQ